MKMMNNFKRAFSMIELIFVIVIIGVIASVGSETVAQSFTNTALQKAQHIATIKSELAAQQIANRLSYAVPWSVVLKNTNDTGMTRLINAPVNDATDRALEWVGVDGDSFEATATPGWSGYCDVDSSTAVSCPTPGSSLGNTDTIIKSLGGAGIGDAIVLFKTDNCISGIQYAPELIGLNGSAAANYNQCAFSLAGSAGTNLVMPITPKVRADMYALAWSAYAIVPTTVLKDINQDGIGDVFDLTLRYGYQPWQGDSFTAANQEIIATNVSVFKFAQNPLGDEIRFKICIKQPIGSTATDFVTACKEKVVLR